MRAEGSLPGRRHFAQSLRVGAHMWIGKSAKDEKVTEFQSFRSWYGKCDDNARNGRAMRELPEGVKELC